MADDLQVFTDGEKCESSSTPLNSHSAVDQPDVCQCGRSTSSAGEENLPALPAEKEKLHVCEHSRLAAQENDINGKPPLTEEVTYEGVLASVGEFGRYQKTVCFLLCMSSLNLGIQLIATVFTFAVPDHRCAIPWLSNDTWRIQNEFHASLVNSTIPAAGLHARSSCLFFHSPTPFHGNVSFWENSTFSASWQGGVHHTPYNDSLKYQWMSDTGNGSTACSRYVYDTSVYMSSISTQLNLVCEQSQYRSHAQMTLMLGTVVGSQLSGLLADMWGRKKSLVISVIPNVALMFTTAFVDNYVLLLVVMFFTGVSVMGCVCPSFVLSMEMVGPSKRLWTSIGQCALCAVGLMVVSLMAYLFRHWSHLQIACAIWTLPLLSFLWVVPESPRWLLSRGRTAEAEVVLTRIARVNKATLTPGVLEKLKVNTAAEMSLLRVCFSAKTLAGRHVIIFLGWFVSGLTHYGLSLRSGALGGNVYVNVVLSGAVEMIAFVICITMLERVGRRCLCFALFLVAGVSCTATILPILYASPDKQWITVMLALIGKCGIAGAFGNMWLYSQELFPTVIRNSAMGASSMCARIGGIVAPYVANLDQGSDGGRAVPLLIFGVPAIVVSLLLLCLPETLKRRLPETVQDAIDMGRVTQNQEVHKG